MNFFKRAERVRLRFLVSIASADWSFNVGDVGELDGETAHKLIANGHAQATTDPVGDVARPLCAVCGGELDDNSQCWSALCCGARRMPTGGRL
jgi:hypothetical protein